MNAKLKAIIDTVWGNDLNNMRYVPQSLDGGTGWGIFDKRGNKFVKKPTEIMGIDPNEPMKPN